MRQRHFAVVAITSKSFHITDQGTPQGSRCHWQRSMKAKQSLHMMQNEVLLTWLEPDRDVHMTIKKTRGGEAGYASIGCSIHCSNAMLYPKLHLSAMRRPCCPFSK